MYKNYLITALLLLSIYTYSQDVSYRQYSSLDGLSSSHVNDLLQDDWGFIWIATNAGLNKFDGYHFTHYDINNGLLDNDIKKIYEDKKKRIWILGSSGKLCYFDNGDFKPYKYNKTILQLTNYTEKIDEKSFFVIHDSVYFNISNVGRILIDASGYVHSVLYKNNSCNSSWSCSVGRSLHVKERQKVTIHHGISGTIQQRNNNKSQSHKNLKRSPIRLQIMFFHYTSSPAPSLPF